MIFGVDEETMESVVLAMLRQSGRTLAVAEGFTGGLAAARLTRIDTGMETFVGGTLGPWGGTAEESPAKGEARAAEAANRVRTEFGASVGIAAIGREPSEEVPPGLARMAVATGEDTATHSVALPGDRKQAREYAVIHLLSFLRRTLPV